MSGQMSIKRITAEYTIGSPRKTQWLHAYNDQGQVIEQLQQIQCRMATNAPIVANYLCERDYLVVPSFDELHGRAIPCLHPYYSKSRKYPVEEEHSLIASLTGQEETYQTLVTALEERFEEFSISPLQNPASGPYVHLHLWHGPKGGEHTECQNKINELVQQGLIWRTDMMGVHQRANPYSKRK